MYRYMWICISSIYIWREQGRFWCREWKENLTPSKDWCPPKAPLKKTPLGLVALILDSTHLGSKIPSYLISFNVGNYQINDYIRDRVLLLNSNGVAILITSVDVTALAIFEQNN